MTIPTHTGAWVKNPLLYEINTRVWLNELSGEAKRPLTLYDVPAEELERIVHLGFHAVWLMGVWTLGEEGLRIAQTFPDHIHEYKQALPDYTLQDIVSSPYAVADYTVSPALGGPAALANFRERLAKFGLKLMLDFVPNHTARDHSLTLTQPDVYICGSADDLARDPNSFFQTSKGVVIAHGRDPYFPAWTDTAQINYGNHAGRTAMKQALLSIAQQCDGVRCDMAMLVLPEIIERVWGSRLGPTWNKNYFWKEAITELRQTHPTFLFLAETYWDLEWQLQQYGFDFTYDKTLYDRLRAKDNNGVRQHLQAEGKYQDHCARFVENHDEPRAVTAFGVDRVCAAASVSFFTPGLKLIHEGQLEGNRVKLPVQLGRRPLETENIEIALFYEKILSILQNSIFQNGTFQLIHTQPAGWGDLSNDALIAVTWSENHTSGNTELRYLIVVNLNACRAYGRVPIPSDKINADRQYVFLDRLDGKHYERPGSELTSPGLYIALEAYQQHIFEIHLNPI